MDKSSNCASVRAISSSNFEKFPTFATRVAHKDEGHMIYLGIAGQVSGARDTRGTGRFLTGSLVELFSKMAAIVTQVGKFSKALTRMLP